MLYLILFILVIILYIITVNKKSTPRSRIRVNAVLTSEDMDYDDVYYTIPEILRSNFLSPAEKTALKRVKSLPLDLYYSMQSLYSRRTKHYIYTKDEILPNYLKNNALQRLLEANILTKKIPDEEIKDFLLSFPAKILKEFSSKLGLPSKGTKKKIANLIADKFSPEEILKSIPPEVEYYTFVPEVRSAYHKTIYYLIQKMEQEFIEKLKKLNANKNNRNFMYELRFELLYQILEFYMKDPIYKDYEKVKYYAEIDIKYLLNDFLKKNKGVSTIPSIDYLFKIYLEEKKYNDALTLAKKMNKKGYFMEDEIDEVKELIKNKEV